jgi:hypothetical protein
MDQGASATRISSHDRFFAHAVDRENIASHQKVLKNAHEIKCRIGSAKVN